MGSNTYCWAGTKARPSIPCMSASPSAEKKENFFKVYYPLARDLVDSVKKVTAKMPSEVPGEFKIYDIPLDLPLTPFFVQLNTCKAYQVLKNSLSKTIHKSRAVTGPEGILSVKSDGNNEGNGSAGADPFKKGNDRNAEAAGVDKKNKRLLDESSASSSNAAMKRKKT